MFTGIVESTGEVLEAESTSDGRRLRIAVPFPELSHGQSIAISGVCLTVEEYDVDADGGWMTVFLAEETLDRTYLGSLQAGDAVNLERAMPADGRLDGHVVQGHVDATGEVLSIERMGDEDLPDATYAGDWAYSFSLPAALSNYVVEKGSIAIDGISLTVADVEEGASGEGTMTVAIVPTTYEETTLSEKTVGDPVHYEVDVLAKYVEKQLEGKEAVGAGIAEMSEALRS